MGQTTVRTPPGTTQQLHPNQPQVCRRRYPDSNQLATGEANARRSLRRVGQMRPRATPRQDEDITQYVTTPPQAKPLTCAHTDHVRRSSAVHCYAEILKPKTELPQPNDHRSRTPYYPGLAKGPYAEKGANLANVFVEKPPTAVQWNGHTNRALWQQCLDAHRRIGKQT